MHTIFLQNVQDLHANPMNSLGSSAAKFIAIWNLFCIKSKSIKTWKKYKERNIVILSEYASFAFYIFLVELGGNNPSSTNY